MGRPSRVLLAAPLAALVAVAGVNAQATPDSTTARAGWGMSYWGDVPPPADSTTAAEARRGTPIWETVLLVPYHAVAFPLRLVATGVGATADWLEEERVLEQVGRLLGPKRGPFGLMMEFSAGGLAGLGGGMAAEHDDLFASGTRIRLRGSFTVTGQRRVTLGLERPTGSGGTLQLGAGYRNRPNARYFGLGPDAAVENGSYYELGARWVGVSYDRRLLGGLSLGAHLLLSDITAEEPRAENTPALATRFSGSLPPGYGTPSPGVTAGLSLTHASTADDGRPNGGGVRRFRVGYFHPTDGQDSRFWTYRVEAQQFVRLWYPETVLALRGVATWISTAGASVVPFQRMMTNDDPDLLRGYEDFRWRGKGLVVLTAEYRWPLWAFSHADRFGADLYVLADVGQVFDAFDQITVDALTLSYGAGIRILNSRGFVLRLEYAHCDEGGVWRLRSDQVFQFAKGDLFHGRDPVPVR